MKNIFTEHPHNINESYFQHLLFAGLFGFKMLLGGCACLIHAIFPFLFINTGSNLLLSMTKNFIERKPSVDDKITEIHQLIESKKIKNVG